MIHGAHTQMAGEDPPGFDPTNNPRSAASVESVAEIHRVVVGSGPADA